MLEIVEREQVDTEAKVEVIKMDKQLLLRDDATAPSLFYLRDKLAKSIMSIHQEIVAVKKNMVQIALFGNLLKLDLMRTRSADGVIPGGHTTRNCVGERKPHRSK